MLYYNYSLTADYRIKILIHSLSTGKVLPLSDGIKILD